MITPILYVVVVGWPTFGERSEYFSSIACQLIALRYVSGAQQATSTEALNVLLDLLPFDIVYMNSEF